MWGDKWHFVFSRVTCLAPLQSPGSGLWNTLSIKPSAHTFCLRSISQKMAMSCSSPTCQICTKSLSGAKCNHSHHRDCMAIQGEAKRMALIWKPQNRTLGFLGTRVSCALCSCSVSQYWCCNLMHFTCGLAANKLTCVDVIFI